ncbi:ATP-binding protein [Bradyrhizobium sp. CCGUVB23]|uniref:ATP-binding protein n=1 Tax=Bradyrhizobium sp. CCGUVB23 TaxID=2949630 RepID=UPI0020B41C9F|nr:ATP-binding protein [Bradyrhizobium sp. CCGUVB23]MCP3468215.1 ATP-binding protein [Bradyrhizobium sp. CCGUVB23]
MTAEQQRDLLEMMEDRHGRGSTVVTSQPPSEHWHKLIGNRLYPRSPRAQAPSRQGIASTRTMLSQLPETLPKGSFSLGQTLCSSEGALGCQTWALLEQDGADEMQTVARSNACRPPKL